MVFKGTPGKWLLRPTYAKREDGVTPMFYDIISKNSEGQSFISTHTNLEMGMTPYQEKANAQLVSCAPEMLEMLQDVVRLADEIIRIDDTGGPTETYYQMMIDIDKLIKKATTI